MRKRVLSIVMVLMMVVSVFPAVSQAATANDLPVGVDISAMNTTDTNGKSYTGEIFSKYQLTVLNVWATWCGPCVREMPYFQQLYESYRDLGVNLMGVLVEDSNSTVAGANNLLASNGFTYPSLRMDAALRNMYIKSFPEGATTTNIPDTYIINDKGVVVSAKVGSLVNYSELENWVLEYWKNPVLENITLPKTAEVGVNRMISLTPEITPVYARIDSMIWTSSDESVATVSNSGLLTGISEGSATITVTAESGDVTMTASCTVTVNPLTPLPDGSAIFKSVDEITDGRAYAVVVNYNGTYYMMSPECTVDGRYRLLGTMVKPEDMLLINTEDGENAVAFTAVPDAYLWQFEKNDENSYYVSNIFSGEYLSSVRANGIYRLNMKSKADTAFAFENGKFMIVTKKHYTDDRQFITYYEDTEHKFPAAFDLLDSGNELFTDVMIFGRTTVDADDPGKTPDPDNPDVTNPPTSQPLLGDVNGNNMVDAGDATMVLRHVVGTHKLDDEKVKIGDMNASGGLDSGDATQILRKAIS